MEPYKPNPQQPPPGNYGNSGTQYPHPNAHPESSNWQRPVEPVLPHVQTPSQQAQYQPHPQGQDPYAQSSGYQPTQYGPTPQPSPQQPAQPTFVHMSQEPSPNRSVLDHSHDRKYQHLNLSKGEVVLAEIRRHPIGVLQIYAVASFVLLALLFGGGALVRFLSKDNTEGLVGGSAFPFPPELVTGLIFGGAILTIIIAAIAIHVYNGNRLYLTNESVIQRVQTSLFHTKEQQITLGNIEDVSYEQSGLLPHLFNYGAVRLSTEGEETTYYFHYAADPKAQAGKITNAQEDFNRANPDHHN